MLTLRDKETEIPEDDGKREFSSLLASAVHDLKNSVGSLLSALNAMDGEPRGEGVATHEMVARLRHEAMHINNDLVALLAVYKIDRGCYPVEIDHHCVHDVLTECALQYAPLLERSRIAVELQCHEDLYGYFDRGLTMGIIINALNNALRHTRDRLLIRAAASQNGLTIAVEDNGPGYPVHLLMSDPGTAGGIDFNGGTTGLGLYFASLAAALHKHKQRRGHIRVYNGGSLGGGCFSLHLP